MSSSIQTLRTWAHEQLAGSALGLEDNVLRLEIDHLLAHTLGTSRENLIAHREKTVSEEHTRMFHAYLERRLACEPLSYISGKKEFYSIDYYVSPAVLIPRPETELVVDRGLEIINSDWAEFSVIDVGLGSGAILLSVLKCLKDRFGADFIRRGRFVGIELSHAAIEVAGQNARELDLDKFVEIIPSDLLECLDSAAYPPGPRLLLSNPPYVRDDEALLPDVCEFEPATALFAGHDGLAVISRLISQARQRYLRPGTQDRALIECGAGQADAVKNLVYGAGFGQCVIHSDLAGIPRVVEFG